MSTIEYPICSVIVLNYFGERIIKNTINSLLDLNFPQDRLEIIIVDNASKDKSKEIISEISGAHENVTAIFLNKNLGFSKGNNVGIKQARGKYVVLLNNDCIVEENWLKELVNVAESDGNIFAVNSKILLYPKYINLDLSTDANIVPVYSWLEKSKLHRPENKLTYLPLWRKNNNYKIEVPVDFKLDKYVEIKVLFSVKGKIASKELKLKQLINFNEKIAKIKNSKISKSDIEITLEISTTSDYFKDHALDKIQNAGIVVFQDGYGRDIGAIVRYHEQFYEYDYGQYNQNREIYAACGASILLRKDFLKQLGYLDESFFMYYEDVDICEKARIAGYKIFYAPKSVVRHIHALSSGEWSSFFIYHVEKGRLLHMFNNFPFSVFLWEYFKLFFKTLLTCLIFPLKYKKVFNFINKKQYKTKQDSGYRKNIQYVFVVLYLFTSILKLMGKRFRLAFSSDNRRLQENYQEILNGRWYSN